MNTRVRTGSSRACGYTRLMGRGGGSKLSSTTPPPIAALLETPLGVLATTQIAAHPSLCALGFGAEDYSGAIGVHPNALALTWPAQQVITGAHAYGLQCWGMAGSIAEVKDLEAFGKDVEYARGIGFTGSVCIHPNQVDIVNQIGRAHV